MKIIAQALVKAQSQTESLVKDSINPHFRSKYASLAAVMDVIRKPLADNGLCIFQSVEGECLKTTLLHESGEIIETFYPLVVAKHDSQGVASAHTYARRYSILGLMNLAPEDDDGNLAQASKAKPLPPPQPRPEPIIARPQPEPIMASNINLVNYAPTAKPKVDPSVDPAFFTIPAGLYKNEPLAGLTLKDFVTRFSEDDLIILAKSWVDSSKKAGKELSEDMKHTLRAISKFVDKGME